MLSVKQILKCDMRDHTWDLIKSQAVVPDTLFNNRHWGKISQCLFWETTMQILENVKNETKDS